MTEATMIELAQGALRESGVDDELIAVGQFNPRGHTGGLFAGGLIGGDAGGRLGGSIGGDVGVATGSLAGQRAADRASGLPASMLVGVSAENVYGFHAPSRRSAPRALVFKLQRSSLEIKIHQRFNVRILEVIDQRSGDRIELEGNRLPITHSADVINALSN